MKRERVFERKGRTKINVLINNVLSYRTTGVSAGNLFTRHIVSERYY